MQVQVAAMASVFGWLKASFCSVLAAWSFCVCALLFVCASRCCACMVREQRVQVQVVVMVAVFGCLEVSFCSALTALSFCV